jgi:hypothetical protein
MQRDPIFVEWADTFTGAGRRSWEEETGCRLAVQGILNALVKLPADAHGSRQVSEHAIGWITSEIGHSPVSITDDHPARVMTAAKNYIAQTLS